MKEDDRLVTQLVMKTGNNWGTGVAIFNKDGELLSCKRTDTKNWCTPGGKVEVGETAVEGAIREVKEEVGISLKPSDLEYVGYDVNAFNNEKVWISFLFVAHVDVDTKVTLQETELSEYEWTSVLKFLKKDVFAPSRILINRVCKKR